MRTALTAAFLAMSLLGVAACSGEDARLRAEIEEKLAVYNELFERRAALQAELYPDWTPSNNSISEFVLTNLSAASGVGVLRYTLDSLADQIQMTEAEIAELEDETRRRAAGEPGPNDVALKRLLTPQ